MSGELKLALSLSVGLHAGLLIGLPVAGRVEFDVERAPTSVEIVLLAPPAPTAPVQEPALPAPVTDASAVQVPEPDPIPKTMVSAAQRGALTELLPSYLRNPAPTYPMLARERGYEGTVFLDVEVLPDGRCGQLRIAQSSGYAVLDDAAASAVRRWRFKPATRGQRPVAVWVELPMTFRLMDTQEDE
jgi:protein TonB